MKHYKSKTQTKTVHFFDKMVCDVCGRETYQYEDWADGGYEVDKVTIRRRAGDEYPDGAYVTTHSVDLCPDCWETKLIPWLESQGATVEKRKDYW